MKNTSQTLEQSLVGKFHHKSKMITWLVSKCDTPGQTWAKV